MMKFIQALLGLSLVVCLAYLSPQATGQVGKHHHSVESLVADADFVAIGRLAGLRRQPVPNSETARLFVQPFFSKILKQPSEKIKPDELESWSSSSDFYQKLIDNESSGVWFVNFGQNGEVSVNPPGWKFLAFEELDGYRQTLFAPPMLANDLSVMKTQAAILARLRQCCEKKTKPNKDKRPTVIGLQVPSWLVSRVGAGDANGMSFVLNEGCEKTARSLIANPTEFCRQRQLKADESRSYQLESLGLELLQHFPSEENTALVKKFMLAPINKLESDSGYLPPRITAFEILLNWGAAVELPSFGQSITKLDLSNSDVDDNTMLLLAKLGNLEELNLSNTQVTKFGLSRLKPLLHLSLIELNTRQVTDDNIQALKDINLLDKISAVGWKRIDGTVVRTGPLTEVESLSLAYCKLTDQGLKAFSSFENVIWINLRDTRISDKGLDSLSHLTQLKTLFVGGTQITDLGVKKIAEHKKLETLSLRGLQISDTALSDLGSLPNLRHLNLGETNVSSQAIAKLQRVLPDCKIVPPQSQK